MPKNFTSNISAEILKEQNAPIHLIELSLDSGTLYFCDAEEDIIFGTQTYTAWAFTFSPVMISLDLQIDSVKVSFDNTNLSMSAYLANNVLQGKRAVIKRIFRGLLGNPLDYTLIFQGTMDSPGVNENVLEINIVSPLDILSVVLPRRKYSPFCAWTFAGVCNCKAIDAEQSSVADSGTTIDLVDTTLTQDDDYWNDGILEILNGDNAGEKRKILDFYAVGNCVTLFFPFDHAITTGTCYTIKRGCNKTISACREKYNNELNFGGFPSVPQGES